MFDKKTKQNTEKIKQLKAASRAYLIVVQRELSATLKHLAKLRDEEKQLLAALSDD